MTMHLSWCCYMIDHPELRPWNYLPVTQQCQHDLFLCSKMINCRFCFIIVFYNRSIVDIMSFQEGAYQVQNQYMLTMPRKSKCPPILYKRAVGGGPGQTDAEHNRPSGPNVGTTAEVKKPFGEMHSRPIDSTNSRVSSSPFPPKTIMHILSCERALPPSTAVSSMLSKTS